MSEMPLVTKYPTANADDACIEYFRPDLKKRVNGDTPDAYDPRLLLTSNFRNLEGML